MPGFFIGVFIEMEYEDRLYHINRMLFCRTLFTYKGRSFYVGNPQPIDRIKAEIIYKKSLDGETWTDEHRLGYLNRILHWGTEDEKRIETLRKEIDDAKIDLYNTGFKKALAKNIRIVIGQRYDELKALLDKRSLYDDTTRESVASQCRFKYIIAASIKREDGTYYYKDPMKSRNLGIINVAIASLLKDSLSESQVRELARTEPWASIWSSSEKCESLFGCSAADLTDEQKILIYWSQLYDNIRVNTELDENTLSDDWKLDGFLIKRRREREKESIKQSVAAKISPKVAQGDMIFVQADNEEEAHAIDSLNDAGARMMKAQLQHEIYRKGQLRYQDSGMGKEQIINQLRGK